MRDRLKNKGISGMVYQARTQIRRKFPWPSPRDCVIWITTEVGELADAMMRLPGFPEVNPTRNNPGTSIKEEAAEEMADVVIMVTTLALLMGINIDDEVRRKLDWLENRYGQG